MRIASFVPASFRVERKGVAAVARVREAARRRGNLQPLKLGKHQHRWSPFANGSITSKTQEGTSNRLRSVVSASFSLVRRGHGRARQHRQQGQRQEEEQPPLGASSCSPPSFVSAQQQQQQKGSIFALAVGDLIPAKFQWKVGSSSSVGSKGGGGGGLSAMSSGRLEGPQIAAVTVVLLLGLYRGVMWLLHPFLVANRRNRMEHPSEDVFRQEPGGSETSRERVTAFPRLDAPPTKVLSVVIPAYNERDRLPSMMDDTLAYLEGQHKKDESFTYEVLVVDDGSSDDTAGVVYGYVQRYGTDVVRLCRLHGNQGKGAAVRKGMLRMRGEYGLMADGDGATQIDDATRLLERLRETERLMGQGNGRFGVAMGSRAHLQSEAVAKRSWYRTLMMNGFHLAVSILCSRTIRDTQCGFKLFTRDSAYVLFDSIHLERWAFDIELVHLCEILDIPMTEVEVNWEEVPGSKLISSKLDVITMPLCMLRDMLCVRVCYMTGVWKASPHVLATVRSPRRNRSRSRSSSSRKNSGATKGGGGGGVKVS